MSATILYSGTDDVFGHIEKVTVRQINRDYPMAVWQPPTYVVASGGRYSTEVEARNIFVTPERCRNITRISGDSTEQSLIVELMDKQFDIEFDGAKAVDCRVSNMSRGIPSVRDLGFVFRDALFIGGSMVDDLVEEDMLGNMLFVSTNDQIVGFVETFKKIKRRGRERASDSPFGSRGYNTDSYIVDCNNLSFSLEYLDDDSETMLLEESGNGIVLEFIYGKPLPHMACPHDCLGLKLSELQGYLEKFICATMKADNSWIPNYVLKSGEMIIGKSKFRWTEQCIMSENSWDKKAPRKAGKKTRFVVPIVETNPCEEISREWIRF